MSLVTRCPKCDSGFAVTADLLKLHDGLVRCGQCSHVFDGFACLDDNLPTLTQKVGKDDDEPGVEPNIASEIQADQQARDESAAVPPERTQTTEPQVFRTVAQRQKRSPQPEQPEQQSEVQARDQEPSLEEPQFKSSPVSFEGRPEPVFRRATVPSEPVPDPLAPREPTFNARTASIEPGSGSTGTLDGERNEPSVKILGEARVRGEDPSASGRTLPDFMEPEEPESPTWTLAWLSGSIVLLVVLLGQLIFIYRDDLASSVPALRPVLEQVCRPLNCEVGYTKRIERIFIVGSSLQMASSQRADSANEHDYLLRLTLQNRYDQAQPWPNLMVALSDPSGTVVVRESLAPSQYLPSTLSERPFGAQEEASLEVPLRVKGSPISGFEIDKFFP